MLPGEVESSFACADVTTLLSELKRANELRREAEIRADTAKKALEMKTMALARMSHDIRTPLHGVLGMTSLLRTTPLTREQCEFVDTIQSSSLFLLGLLRDILDHSKMEAGKIDLEASPLNVMKVIDECAKTLSFETSTKDLDIKIEFHDESSNSGISSDMFHIGDTLRLKQIVLNYLSNAVKFSSPGGVITIDVYMGPGEAEGLRTGPYDIIKLQVSDCGIGIADPSKLFKPFTQASASTSRQYGGSGLGLSIARVLTELMGGEVGISSEPGRGTSVWSTIRLPRASSCEAMEECSSPEPVAPSSPMSSLRSEVTSTADEEEEKSLSTSSQSFDCERKEDSSWREHCSILVAEDNVVNQKVLTHMLRRLGYRHIVMTSDGLQAVEEIRRSWSDRSECWYDIVLMDCQMPVMDGPEASVAIRLMEKEAGEAGGQAGYGRIPIVALTASALKSDKELCLSSGMDDFVTKPIDMSHLDEIITNWAQPAKVGTLSSP